MGLYGRFVDSAKLAGALAGIPAMECVAAELVARWSEPHRHYHNVTHLEVCLSQVEDDPIAALAAWGHDAIYNPQSRSNEERSALLMTGLLWRCELPAGVIAEVARLIRMTASHTVDPHDTRGKLLAQADLAILSAPWAAYTSYVDAVRAEYAHVPDPMWRIGRSAVLESLLDLPVLPAAARVNLTRELRQYR